VSVARRWVRPLAGLAVGAIFVLLLTRRVEWNHVRQVLAGADWLPLAVGLLALTADMAARIGRWWWMLRAAQPDLSLGACVRPFLGSLALNNTVPLRAGDLVRVFGFRRTLRAPAAHVLGTLLLERVLDLLVLLAILFLGVLGTSGRFPQPLLLLAALVGAAAAGGLLAVTLLPDRITALFQWLVLRHFNRRNWAPKAARALGELTGSLGLLRSPQRATWLLGLSVVAWVFEGLVFVCVAWSLHVQVPWPAPWLSLAAATLSTLLPSSPGYVGTFDYFAAVGLTAYGATHAVAVAFALVAHLILWLPVTTAGVVGLLLGRRAGVPTRLRAERLRADPV
jgi:glycosyltransferase 2 family protein